MLAEVATRLSEKNITLEVKDRFKERVVQEGYNPSQGARPLRRAIMRLLEDTLAQALLSGQLAAGDTAIVDVDDDGQVTVRKAEKPQLALASVGS
jgi:ATP-dependent Clp protease ATP-binding subunit ClpC